MPFKEDFLSYASPRARRFWIALVLAVFLVAFVGYPLRLAVAVVQVWVKSVFPFLPATSPWVGVPIVWGIATAALLLIYYPIWALVRSAEKIQAEQKLLQQKAELETVEAYFGKVIEARKLFPVSSNFRTGSGEKVYLETESVLTENLAKSVTVGTVEDHADIFGRKSSEVRSETTKEDEWVALDAGTLTLTDRRLVFLGEKVLREVPINAILQLKRNAESISVTAQGFENVMLFSTGSSHPMYWDHGIWVFTSEEDPAALSDECIEATRALDLRYELEHTDERKEV